MSSVESTIIYEDYDRTSAECMSIYEIKFNKFVKNKDNCICADCKKIKPFWVSVNIGVFICVNCAGIHRRFGSNISQIKSLTLDKLTNIEMEFIVKHGNKEINDNYEAFLPNDFIIPESYEEFYNYLFDKYVNKKFVLERNIHDNFEISICNPSTDRSVNAPHIGEIMIQKNICTSTQYISLELSETMLRKNTKSIGTSYTNHTCNKQIFDDDISRMFEKNIYFDIGFDLFSYDVNVDNIKQEILSMFYENNDIIQNKNNKLSSYDTNYACANDDNGICGVDMEDVTNNDIFKQLYQKQLNKLFEPII